MNRLMHQFGFFLGGESFGITGVEATKYSPNYLVDDGDRDFLCNDRVLSP